MDSEKNPMVSALQPFKDANPTAGISANKDVVLIQRPWNDKTIAIRVSQEDSDLIEALNNLYLPPSLTAVWHSDARRLELIYSVVRKGHNDLVGRRFTFNYGGRAHKCSFGESSDRLIRIAQAYVQVETPTRTSGRNLAPFHWYAHSKSRHEELVEGNFPCSFWIEGLDWQEDDFRHFALTLSFYMLYLDRASPIVLLHEPEAEDAYQPERYRAGTFPVEITTKELRLDLLTIWSGTWGADSMRRFVYAFQILEHAAFYFMKDELARDLRRLITAPEAVTDTDRTIEAILNRLVSERQGVQDEARIRQMFPLLVPFQAIWREIDHGRSFFANKTEFEGGFVADAIIGEKDAGDGGKEYEARLCEAVCNQFIKLRNALVHSRESRSSTTITPTARNYQLLSPWAVLIMAAAEQVILNWT